MQISFSVCTLGATARLIELRQIQDKLMVELIL